MKTQEIQDYFDDNIDDIELEKSDNALFDGLTILHEENLGWKVENIVFDLINGDRFIEVEVEECSEEAALALMKLNWSYEDGRWVYYE